MQHSDSAKAFVASDATINYSALTNATAPANSSSLESAARHHSFTKTLQASVTKLWNFRALVYCFLAL